MTGSCERCGCPILVVRNRRYCSDCRRHGTRRAEPIQVAEADELVRLYARLREPMPRALIGRVLGISETRIECIERRALIRARAAWEQLYSEPPPF